MGKLDGWAQDLLDGAEGTDVLESMRGSYSDCSLGSKVSIVRRLFMEAGPLHAGQRNTHPSLAAGLKRLEREADRLEKKGQDGQCAKLIRTFLSGTLREKSKFKRSFERKTLCLDDERASDVFAGLKLLPDNLDSFRVSRDVTDKCVARSRASRMRKNETPMVIKDGAKTLAAIAGVLSNPADRTIPALIVSLCFVSGRRTSEIANGRSVFRPLGKKEEQQNGCEFKGQLKNERKRDTFYPIPLLVPYPLFARGLKALRERQGDVTGLTNSEVSKRYQGNLDMALRPLFPELKKAHDLRAAYCSYVFGCFSDATDMTLNLLIMRILGHATLEESLRYNSVVVKKVDGVDLGPLPGGVKKR